ncbi:Conserved hypothetical protein 95 [Caloramator fervidus]|uniref:16S rRNA (Guanine(966)-N(2))-methyltransferase RsmD n=1 Tax=Caloramator fervidus TaxID=29344 RepID=A0A1H5TX50_9CLOT|nr:16S rRNA (guanine(966)-N(2))-methyltransferase RsmD [Caloramator fervidus]SEF67376.1 Conserved hypothetical protein 95 [Caloramator fervidus]
MRIITGEAKGRIIKAPPGLNTRPTSDRVKESIFNIISKKIADSYILDMFAGTGNLGLEALSRGAKFCTFIELDRLAYSFLVDNVKSLNYQEKSEVFYGDAFKILKGINKKYDIIFLDPPYGKSMVEKAINLIFEEGIFGDETLIVSELDVKDIIPEKIGCFINYRTEKYGRTKVAFWIKE